MATTITLGAPACGRETSLMTRAAQKRLKISASIGRAADENRLAEVTVGDVMTPTPTSVAPHTSAIELVHFFQQNRFRHLLVTENKQLVGVVSDRDVLRLMGQEDFNQREQWDQFAARDLMCENPLTATTDMPLVEAVQTIAERGITCLPVMHEGEVVGILTATDLYLTLEQVLAALATQPV